jgi:dinuclear metal center YbgI/SA1388 family protein
MNVNDLVNALEAIAPPSMAEEWDNVGLLVGDPTASIARVLLTIDYTPDVAAEAREANCGLVIAYHPPLFKPIKRIVASGASELLFAAIRDGIAIYSPHTAFDAADSGTNDVLADGLSLADRRPLRHAVDQSAFCKLVTFVPAEALEKVSDALFEAGAGKIGGKYSRCSFRTDGTGTFQGDADSSPAVGEAGKFERVPEIKIETVVERSKLEAVVRALKISHPYEEPAFDLTALVAPPTGNGQGRIGNLPSDVTLEMVGNLLKRIVGVERLLVVGDRDRMIRKVAICAGSGGDLLPEAIAAKVDLFITGELRHHDALSAQRAGVAVLCTLHTNSERIALARLADRLREKITGVEFVQSTRDRDPFSIY